MYVEVRLSMLIGMDVKEPVQVTVSLEPAAETIQGRIAVDGAPATEFFGWLELIGRIERAAGMAHGQAPLAPARNE